MHETLADDVQRPLRQLVETPGGQEGSHPSTDKSIESSRSCGEIHVASIIGSSEQFTGENSS